jgi:hypothetical protein
VAEDVQHRREEDRRALRARLRPDRVADARLERRIPGRAARHADGERRRVPERDADTARPVDHDHAGDAEVPGFGAVCEMPKSDTPCICAILSARVICGRSASMRPSTAADPSPQKLRSGNSAATTASPPVVTTASASGQSRAERGASRSAPPRSDRRCSPRPARGAGGTPLAALEERETRERERAHASQPRLPAYAGGRHDGGAVLGVRLGDARGEVGGGSRPGAVAAADDRATSPEHAVRIRRASRVATGRVLGAVERATTWRPARASAVWHACSSGAATAVVAARIPRTARRFT